MILLFAVFVIGGFGLAGVCYPLTQRKIRPNLWYGVRLKATLTDEKVWYDVNEYLGRRIMIAGVITAFAALIFFPLGMTPDGYSIAVGLVVVVLTVVIGKQGADYMKTLKS
jgi:hypothetical protein